MAKGLSFERDVCRRLSEWFSGGADDDLFWRSAASGGRATVRRKKGKRTVGHYGDICATSSEGEPFTAFVTTEVKRGYNRITVNDLLDNHRRAGDTLASFIRQAMTAAAGAGTPHWLIIHKRDRFDTMVYADYPFLKTVVGHPDRMPLPCGVVRFAPADKGAEVVTVGYLLFDKFLKRANVRPFHDHYDRRGE